MYAEERVDAEEEPSEERAGRVEDSRSDMREYGERWGYGSGNWDGSGSGGTLGGRANERVGGESKRKEDSPSERDRVRGACKNEWLAWGDSMELAAEGEGSSRLEVSVGFILVELGALWSRDQISLRLATDGVKERGCDTAELGEYK